MRRALKLILVAVLAIGVLGGGALIYFYLSSKTVRTAVHSFVLRADTPEKAFPGRDEINVLLMGRDLDRDRRGRILDTHGRTDAIMLAHVDFHGRDVNVLSIPRDTLVRIPGYRGKRRINSANALGGPELAQETVATFLGVRPDYYLVVSFDAFEDAIDMIDGLQVNVDKKLDYDDNWGDLHIHLEPGSRVLNGEQAMGFVRYRQSNAGVGESDFVRIQRQQELVKAVRARLTAPQVMFRAPRVLDTIFREMEGNLTPAQILCLVRFLRSVPGDSGIRMETLPATSKGGVFVKADVDATRVLVDDMFFDNQR